jgi:adenosylcobinamide-GDP ribazoletransferase
VNSPLDPPTGPWPRLKLALAFLTRFPVRAEPLPGGPSLVDAVDLFPLVGALVGACAALSFALASWAGLPSLPAAILALATLVLLTGALHEDGLADTADGFGGGATKEQKLAIMRDSRIGTFGVVALVFVLVGRLIAVAGFWDPVKVAATLVAAGAMSRAAMVLAMTLLAPARSDGLGATVRGPRPLRVIAALLLAVLLTFALLPVQAAALAVAAALVATLALAWVSQRQIGGYTGDVLGAVQQLSETAFLFALMAAASQ